MQIGKIHPQLSFLPTLISSRFTFDLPPPDTPLSQIRSSIAEYTHLPRDAFKLIHKGAVMKDDNAPSQCPLLSP